MPDIQYQSENQNLIAKKSGSITYTHDFEHKNVLDSNIQQTLGSYYNHIVFDPSSRTIWHEGVPYGTSYQFNDSTEHYNNDVFGDINTHQVSGNNNVLMGNSNQTGHKTQNGLFIGAYNKCDDSSYSYIFTIGNGENDSTRSNLLAIHKATDSSDRTQTSLTGYLNVEHLESNISDSYVSSLGKSATADIILKALLTPADYYKPSGLSFTLTNTVQNIECGQKIAPIQVSSVKLPTKMSKYDYQYIADYIKKNNKLPDKINLSDLGYAWTFCNKISDSEYIWWTDKYNDSSKRVILKNANQTVNLNNNQLETTINGDKIYTPNPSTVSPDILCDITDINKIVNLDLAQSNGSNTVIDFNGITLNNPGTYKCGKQISTSVLYTIPQLSYFKQLVDNGVYVVSDKNAWTNNGILQYNISNDFITIYTGFMFYYGLCQADASIKQNSDFFKNLLEGGNTVTKKIIKQELTTYNKGSVLNGDIKYYTNLFGSNISEQYNCAFICFPEDNLSVTPTTIDKTKYWYYKSGPGDPESTVSGNTEDSRNYDYTFTSNKLCISGQNIVWRVIAVKSPNNFAMSAYTSSWYGLKINANKKF